MTDNGSAYTSAPVELWPAEHGVLHLLSLPHTPRHNAQAERAIGMLKDAAEIRPSHPPIRSPDEARAALDLGVTRLHAVPVPWSATAPPPRSTAPAGGGTLTPVVRTS